MRWLTAIPVFNEAAHVESVLAEVRRHSPEILTIDDGSTDATPALLDAQPGLRRIRHESNRGYGAALSSAFDYAVAHGFDVLVTMDCDGQHEPARIPVLLEAIFDCDIASGSRYLRDFRQNTPVPEERLMINRTVSAELNARYGLNITDAFCGFKAYRTGVLPRLHITEVGWGMPLQLWVQAAKLGLRVREVGVPRVYLDPKRAFGGVLNDPAARLAHYRAVIESADRSFQATPMPDSWTCRELCS
jgi:dolichol-phosphate mannosyltransferase